MADENPRDPLAARLDEIIDSCREAPREEAFVTVPGAIVPLARRLLATEREALVTFARTNGIDKNTLWQGVTEINDRGRITVANFVWCEVKDPSALASCTEIRNLALISNNLSRWSEVFAQRLWLDAEERPENQATPSRQTCENL